MCRARNRDENEFVWKCNPPFFLSFLKYYLFPFFFRKCIYMLVVSESLFAMEVSSVLEISTAGRLLSLSRETA